MVTAKRLPIREPLEFKSDRAEFLAISDQDIAKMSRLLVAEEFIGNPAFCAL